MGDEVNKDTVQKEKTKKVTIDRKKLKENRVKKAEKIIELPELNKLMNLDDGEIAVVKVQQLELNEYLACQINKEDRLRNLIDGIVAAAEKQGEVEDELISIYKGLSEKARYYIDICLKGIVEPKLDRADMIFLSRRFPLVIEQIAAEIIMLTKGGADIKKNS